MTFNDVGNLPIANEFPVTQLENLPDSVISIMGIDQTNMQTVESGDTTIVRPETDAVWSDGFIHCAGLIVRSSIEGGFQFTHSWSRDEPALRRMKADPPLEALLVYGSQSEPQYDIELFLGARQKLRRARADTGNVPFGILFNPRNGLVSVVRRAPVASVVQFSGFKL